MSIILRQYSSPTVDESLKDLAESGVDNVGEPFVEIVCWVRCILYGKTQSTCNQGWVLKSQCHRGETRKLFHTLSSCLILLWNPSAGTWQHLLNWLPMCTLSGCSFLVAIGLLSRGTQIQSLLVNKACQEVHTDLQTVTLTWVFNVVKRVEHVCNTDQICGFDLGK